MATPAQLGAPLLLHLATRATGLWGRVWSGTRGQGRAGSGTKRPANTPSQQMVTFTAPQAPATAPVMKTNPSQHGPEVAVLRVQWWDDRWDQTR